MFLENMQHCTHERLIDSIYVIFNDMRITKKQLRQIFNLGGKELVLEMLELFNQHVTQSFANSAKHIKEDNLTAVASELHSVKSSLGNVGAIGMFEFVREMEELISNGDTFELKDKLILLQQNLSELKLALQKYSLEMEKNGRQ